MRRSADLSAFLFWALGILSASAQDRAPLPPVRPPSSHEAPPAAPAAPAPPSSPPVPSVQPQAAAGACVEELKASQIEAEAASSPHASPDACSIAEPVRITSIGLHGGGKLDLPAHPLLDCSFALAFAGFLRDLVAPLGEAMLGATVVMLDTGPGYYCRDVDRVSGAKVNPHGKGIAIDVSAVLLADRRRIAVGHEASPQEALFMQTMRRAGCGYSCRSHRGVGCRSGNGRRGSRPYWGQVTQIKVPLIALTAHRPGPGSIVMASTPRQRLVGRRPCPIERSPLRRLPQDDVAVALARPPHRPWARPPACPQALTKAGDASSVRRDWRMTHGRRPPERN